MMASLKPWQRGRAWFALLSLLTALVYWPGLHGSYIFDDFSNIVDNTELHITDASVSNLTRAALSSPSSEFKRPLASLSFAMNYLSTGLDPWPMKLTNLALHLLNGLLLFLIGGALLRKVWHQQPDHAERVAAVTAGGWLLLPINLTAVLYVVQRMESLSHCFVLLGLLGYLYGRRHMHQRPYFGLLLCTLSLAGMTGVGALAKESAVLLPLYAFLMELLILGGLRDPALGKKLQLLFGVLLALPLLAGIAWLAPRIADPHTWATRDFSLYERLLTEGRVVLSYIGWTLLPLPKWLPFYHDNYLISRSWTTPWSTLPSIALLALLAAIAWKARHRRPMFAVGIAWYFGAHTLTATVLPLELVFEHRNYFASYGLLLALFSLLLPPRDAALRATEPAPNESLDPRRMGILCAGLFMITWTGFSAMSASIWSNPLRLGMELEARAPDSPRAQYEIGRTFLIYSAYDPSSPFVSLAFKAFEASAEKKPKGSILPEQALIFSASRMRLPINERWWDSMLTKLRAEPPSVEDNGAIGSLVICARNGSCDLPASRMLEVFSAAFSHPDPSAILQAAYGDYAWNVLNDQELGLRMAESASSQAPGNPVYLITHIKMLAALSRSEEVASKIQELMKLPGWYSASAVEEALRGNAELVPATDPLSSLSSLPSGAQ